MTSSSKIKSILGWILTFSFLFIFSGNAFAKEEVTLSEIKQMLVKMDDRISALERGQEKLNAELGAISTRIDDRFEHLNNRIDDLRTIFIAVFIPLSVAFLGLMGVLLGYTISLHSRVGRIEGKLR